MKYDYITKNNLINKQNYMYSQFGGKAFWDAYIYERKTNILSDSMERTEEYLVNISILYERISEIKRKISNNEKGVFENLNKLVQSFEVRKRLYSNINLNWIPEDKNGYYEDYDSYLVFAETLDVAFSHTKNLKYLNCLLKVDDTLISIKEFLSDNQRFRMSSVIKKEILYVLELAKKLGINMEGEKK